MNIFLEELCVTDFQGQFHPPKEADRFQDNHNNFCPRWVIREKAVAVQRCQVRSLFSYVNKRVYGSITFHSVKVRLILKFLLTFFYISETVRTQLF